MEFYLCRCEPEVFFITPKMGLDGEKKFRTTTLNPISTVYSFFNVSILIVLCLTKEQTTERILNKPLFFKQLMSEKNSFIDIF